MSPALAERIFGIIVIANGAAVASGMLVSLLLRRRIGALRPEGLGGFNYSIGGTVAFMRYLFGSGHRELRDPLVDRLALAYKLLLFAVVGFLSVGLVDMFWPRETDRTEVSGPVHPGHTHPLNADGAAILALIGFYVALFAGFCRYLRQAHPEIWQRLGRPSLIMNNTPITTSKVLGFIWSAEHNDIGDSKLSIAIFVIRLVSLALIGAVVFLGRRA
jgi:hypothetical protein